MGPPAVTMLLVVVLGLTAALHNAEGTSIQDEEQDYQCSALEKRQSLIENQLNERDSDLNKQLNALRTEMNSLDQRLSAQVKTLRSDVNTRLNKIDSRLDGIEIGIANTKDSLQLQLNDMDNILNESLRCCETQQDVSTAQPDTTSQQDTSTAIPETTPQPDTTTQQDDNVTEKPQVYRGCQDALAHGLDTSGVYTIAPDSNNIFNVYCEQDLEGGGWAVIQSRFNGSVDFYNNWNEYKNGFGTLETEFWLGNDNIYILTKQHDQELMIELTNPEGQVEYVNYDNFWIRSENNWYMLTVTGYSGGSPPGDSMKYHHGSFFSTAEADHDAEVANCAQEGHGGWWYKQCNMANLNGEYGSTVRNEGMNWETWGGNYESMKTTRMMIRKGT